VYLLDTNVVSEFRKRRPNPALIEWFNRVDPDALAISSLFAFEAEAGIAMMKSSAPDTAAAIELWLNELLDSGRFTVLPFDVPAARIYGNMFAAPELKSFLLPDPKSKRPKSGVDLMLAATATAADATMVTFNVSDFRRIHARFPLPGLFDPGANAWIVQRGAGSSG
jgi:predicted nucleic acid-binding protein